MRDHSSIAPEHLISLLATVGVGTWDWELSTGRVVYSAEWAQILGYSVEELPQVVDTWERLVLPEDLLYANSKIECHLNGTVPLYEAEFRMCHKDGSIIWAQDKGRVTEYDEEGKPLRFMGVLQNVTRLKETELRLLENQETLDLAVNVADLGTWDWDIPGNYIRYNDEYLKMLGYSQGDMSGSIEEWENTNHPEDLVRSSKLLDDYISGKIPAYQCEIRMKHRDGYYIWTRDVGKIVGRAPDGTPTRLLGGHMNIDELKQSERRLTEALEALEHNNEYLEQEIAHRTKELVEQDKMLLTVNQISRRLLTSLSSDNFEEMVHNCLRMLGESMGRNRVYIWKDYIDEAGTPYCTQIHEWVRDAVPTQGAAVLESIPYSKLPSFAQAINADCCLNSLIGALSDSEQAVLAPWNIKSILIAPVTINGKRWGFIGVDNCQSEQLFTSIEETALLMSGSMLGSTIEKMETDARLREMEELTQIMLDATPLCCNLWTTEFQNMSCNQEAVRLFQLNSKEEYLKNFSKLSPEYQPCGKLSDTLAVEYISKAFRDGYGRFEWLHQKLDGTLIPAEITLVRMKYKNTFIVAGYTRDLREHRAMLTQLQSQEDDLRAARDEALLSSKAKSNFLANMSHEIRTPMNAISGLAELIVREEVDDKILTHAVGIKSACGNLMNIINDILDISKIESGKLEIFHSQYELASVLNDVITIARMRLGKKKLMFITDIDSHLPARLMGDEIRIKQILINLLSNAIKFTAEGHIALRVTGEVDGTRATLRFCVADSGSGIQQSDLRRLFDEFERINTTKNRNIEGTGLGLAISKQLCEMMGGHIEVESVYGTGSEFTAIIPQECPAYERLSHVPGEKTVLVYEPRELLRKSIAQSLENLDCTCVSCGNVAELHNHIWVKPYHYILTAVPHLGKVQDLVSKHELPIPVAVFSDQDEVSRDLAVYTMLFPISCLQLAPLLNGQLHDGIFAHRNETTQGFVAPEARVLIVDDNAINLCVAEGLMAPYQFTIETAMNGLEALELIQRNHYDLVFMDHMMPRMDGIDATIAIRQLKGDYYQQLPIVALTANALVGTREMFIREGMNDFLAKPIELNRLAQILRKWIPSDLICHTALTTPESKSQTTTLYIAGINTAQGILSVGGNLENYLQILTAFYADGNQKCVSLVQHLSNGDIKAFRTEIHAIKSTCATIGAVEVSALAAKLESAAQRNDATFIDNRIDSFLTNFKEILQTIRPVLPNPAVHIQSIDGCDGIDAGDMDLLRRILPALCDAARLANISQIEQLTNQLLEFLWPEEIKQELHEIRRYISLFDYDGVLACALRLQEQ